MRHHILIMIILFVVSSFNTKSQSYSDYQSNADSIISSIVSHVNSDSISYVIQSLQDFQTRFLLTTNRFSAADWIENRFHEIGITDVERDSSMCHTTYPVDTTTLQINIIGTIRGTTRPDEVYIIGGHYDSFAYGSPFTNAPGADDNASGTASALEFARALIESGYQSEATIKFIAFAAEELMLFGDAGSEHYAQKVKNEGMDIRLMVNCDMISYTTKPVDESSLRIHYYSGFSAFRDSALLATQQFSLLTPISGSLNMYGDSYQFFVQGYPPLYLEEDDFSPYYHSVDDVISNYNMDYCREVIKTAGATLLKVMLRASPNDVKNDQNNFPTHINLSQNYPNPFNPATKIKYRITEPGFVSLKVFDALGNLITSLVSEEKPAGEYVVEFKAKELPSGIYYYQINTNGYLETRKMLLLK